MVQPHKSPEAQEPAVRKWGQNGLSRNPIPKCMYVRHATNRSADNTTTRPSQTIIFDSETTETRTNAAKRLFKTETDNVSGKCTYVVRTCSAYTVALSLADRTGRSFHRATGRDHVPPATISISGAVRVPRSTSVKAVLGRNNGLNAIVQLARPTDIAVLITEY